MDLLRSHRELLDCLAHAPLRQPPVSQWSVGQHVQHCTLATSGVLDALATSQPGAASERFSVVKSVVMITGFIPRGRGQAPAATRPDRAEADLDPVAVRAQMLALIEALPQRVAALPPTAWFTHPVFGVLQTAHALRFIRIHNVHHLKIMREIMRRSAVERTA